MPPEVYIAKINRQASRRAMPGAKYEEVDLKVVYKRDNGVCHLCGEFVPWIRREHKDYYILGPTRDHIVPVSLGGDHTYENINLAHFGCNVKKGNRYEVVAL